MRYGIFGKKIVILLSIMCLGLQGCGSSTAIDPVKKETSLPIAETPSESTADIAVKHESEEEEPMAEPEEIVMGENMMIAEINGERTVFYLEYTYSSFIGPDYSAYNPSGERSHIFSITIDKDCDKPGTYTSAEVSGTYFVLTNNPGDSGTNSYSATHTRGNFTYEITYRDETGTHYQGNFDAILVRNSSYSGANKNEEVTVSGEFDFTLGEVHEMAAEMKEKGQSGQASDVSEPQQTVVPNTGNSGGAKGGYTAQLCNYCNGTGACNYCDGLGDCEHCLGMGYDYCSTCSGTGNCQKCYGQGGELRFVFGGDNKWVQCTRCNGTGNCTRCNGNRELPCNYCGRSGDCNYCFGSGECQYCGGTGQ